MKTKIILIICFLGIFCSSNAQTGGIITVKIIPKEITEFLSYSASLEPGGNGELQLCGLTIVGVYNNRLVNCEMDSLPKKGPVFDKCIEYVQRQIAQGKEIEIKGKWAKDMYDTKKDVFKLVEIIVKN